MDHYLVAGVLRMKMRRKDKVMCSRVEREVTSNKTSGVSKGLR